MLSHRQHEQETEWMSSVIYFKLSRSREKKKTETVVTVEPRPNCHIRTHSGDFDDTEDKKKPKLHDWFAKPQMGAICRPFDT